MKNLKFKAIGFIFLFMCIAYITARNHETTQAISLIMPAFGLIAITVILIWGEDDI
jgi:hypothetical protein